MSGSLAPSAGGCFVRHLSSTEANPELLSMGPTVVVPPKHLIAPSDASEVAAAMETARHELDRAASPGTPVTPPETCVTDKYAYAFDIDGVLIHGGKVILEAIEAMKMLNGENEFGIKVPYIFVTNGGPRPRRKDASSSVSN